MRKLGLSSILIAVTLLTVVVIADGQQTGKVPRIGFLDSSIASASAVLVESFRQELSKLGWIEGKNIAIEYRFAEGQPKRQPELAAELVRLKVDLIVVSGIGVALAAKKATTTIPIVMTRAGDPVALGLVASLARPGGNVTGLSTLPCELITKRLEVLKDAVPKLARVGVLLSPAGGGRVTERAQVGSSGAQVKIGGDRDSTRTQRFRERFPNRQAEAGGRNYDDRQSVLFGRKKADRRACW